MLRPVFIFLLLLCTGCGSGTNQVEFVVPNGFRGDIVLKHEPNAPPLPVVSRRYVVEVPESGVLAFGGYWPFGSYLYTGRFANGDRLWVSERIDDRPEKAQLGLYSGPSRMSSQLKLPEYHWFVGTEEQSKSHRY
jgi:hypothetical protein